MKALGYFRVAPDSAMAVGPSSLVEQEKAFFRFCEEHGYQPVATFVDVDAPEKKAHPEYLRMLDYLHEMEKGFVVVVVKNIDRLSSNPQETLRYILEMENMGAKVMSIDEASTDALSSAMKSWSRKRTRVGVAEKIRNAMRAKAIRGEGLGRPAYGYRIAKDGKFHVVPEEATIVKLIYRLYTEEKLGIRLVARHLNEKGIKTRRGGNWNMVTIRGILRNRTYLGTYNRFGMRIPGSHSAIIEQEVFGKVQERMSNRPRPEGYSRGEPFLLAGLAYCGQCSNRMIGISRHQTWTRQKDGAKTRAEYRYYQCESRTNQSVCRYNTRRAKELEGEVLEKLRQHHITAGQGDAVSTAEPDSSGLEGEKLRSRLKLLEKRMRRHIQQVSKGKMSVDSMRNLSAELVQEQRSLERRLGEIESHAAERSIYLERKKRLEKTLTEICERWESLSFTERRALLLDVVDRVVVHDDKIDLVLRDLH